MTYIFSEIKLPDYFKAEEHFELNNSDNSAAIKNLSRINFFVGANNSGKSRFIRELSKIKDYEFSVHGKDLFLLSEKLGNWLKVVENKLSHPKFSNFKYSIRNEYSKPFNIKGTLTEPTIPEIEFFNKDYFESNISKALTLRKNQLIHYLDEPFLINQNYSDYQPDSSEAASDFVDLIKDLISENKDLCELINSCIINNIDFNKIYIPTLRGITYLHTDKADPNLPNIYKNTVSKNYFQNLKNGQTKPDIFTGFSLYWDIRKMLLGDHRDREKIKQYENFLQKYIFDGKQITLIPKEQSGSKDVSENQTLFIKIGSTEEREIYNLGDGIQSLIILTFQMFKEDNALFFIEEPELNLHPGMQRKFIEAMIAIHGEEYGEKNHQFFITTHSNHMLDMTLDYEHISVYNFHKSEDKNLEKFKVTNVSVGDQSTLELLGVKSSSVFLSNCTIWVEGITDRLYIRKFIELYQLEYPDKKVQEDIDYSFVEYGGGNITHWSFLEPDEDNDSILSNIDVVRLCSTLFLISDKDSSDSKAERHKMLEKNLKDRYYCLQCREIENLLTLDTILEVVKEYENSTQDLAWPKFRKNTMNPHQNTHLGPFIHENLFIKFPPKRKGGYKEEKYGQLKNKVDFCKRALKHLKTYADLSDEAKELAQKIHAFIWRMKGENT